MSPGYHLKGPNVPQNLNHITSPANLQKLKRIPDCKEQGAKHKDRDGKGASCVKSAVCKRAECDRRMNYTCLKEPLCNHSSPQPVSTEGSFPVERKLPCGVRAHPPPCLDQRLKFLLCFAELKTHSFGTNGTGQKDIGLGP